MSKLAEELKARKSDLCYCYEGPIEHDKPGPYCLFCRVVEALENPTIQIGPIRIRKVTHGEHEGLRVRVPNGDRLYGYERFFDPGAHATALAYDITCMFVELSDEMGR